MQSLWLLLLPIAAASGWIASTGRTRRVKKRGRGKFSLPKDYLQGLNYLLNEEHDKALDLFIKMLEVDSETVETHLTLGNLFRRRGEVDRATRIHQNLIARPNLTSEYRTQALLALAQDYLSAGVFDRAERLFLELLEAGKYTDKSIRSLLTIYEQEKDWKRAIGIAKRQSNQNRTAISHYYCELAQRCLLENRLEESADYLKEALASDKHCARASLLLAKIDMKLERYKQAIKALKHIRAQDPDYFSEAILPLSKAYQAVGKEKEMVLYFRDLLKEYPKMPVAILLSERIKRWRGQKVAADFAADYVREHPSIAGLHHLVELHLPLMEGKAKQDLQILHRLTQKLVTESPQYQCTECGFQISSIHWQCPSCKRWGTIKPAHTLALD